MRWSLVVPPAYFPGMDPRTAAHVLSQIAGLLDLLRIPGLAAPRIHLLHQSLGIDSVEALESAALYGRLKTLKGFGPKTAQKILAGISFLRASGSRALHHRGVAEARALLATVHAHPDVVTAEVAGSVRRHGETVGDTDIVAACRSDPLAVAASFVRAPGIRAVTSADSASPGGVTGKEVLNARSASEVLSFARARRAGVR